VCKLYRGLFWRNCGLNYCTVLYFSEIKWYREHLEATMHLDTSRDIWQMKTYFERVCGSYVGVHTAEDILVTSKMTNSVFSRQNVWAHGPCNKRFAWAQNRRDADPVKSEKVKGEILLASECCGSPTVLRDKVALCREVSGSRRFKGRQCPHVQRSSGPKPHHHYAISHLRRLQSSQ